MQILIVGALAGQIGAASRIAMARGATVCHAHTIDQALDILRQGNGIDLIMADVMLNIGDFVKFLHQERIRLPVVACGVGTDVKRATQAIRAGAKEYLPLPPDAELIAAVLSAATEEKNQFIFADPKMKNVVALAEKIAPSDASIFITGPSGTGKEMIARHICQSSKRHDKRFVAVNCAAIPEALLESELFGHEKGAFTGAVARRIGKIEEANGGTLLFDEISEMHPSLQVKLLRAIQEKEIDRIGSNNPIKVNVRFLATSNRDMQAEVAKGTFREDLYFRLNVMDLHIPTLAERPADIPVLADFFAERYAKANDLDTKKISAEGLTRLLAYSWPGNVRELENTIHRAVLVADGDAIDEAAIILPTGSSARTESTIEGNENLIGRTVADVERDLIISTLEHCLGNRTHAANILGISIRTLRNKLKLYQQGDPSPIADTARK